MRKIWLNLDNILLDVLFAEAERYHLNTSHRLDECPKPGECASYHLDSCHPDQWMPLRPCPNTFLGSSSMTFQTDKMVGDLASHENSAFKNTDTKGDLKSPPKTTSAAIDGGRQVENEVKLEELNDRTKAEQEEESERPGQYRLDFSDKDQIFCVEVGSILSSRFNLATFRPSSRAAFNSTGPNDPGAPSLSHSVVGFDESSKAGAGRVIEDSFDGEPKHSSAPATNETPEEPYDSEHKGTGLSPCILEVTCVGLREDAATELAAGKRYLIIENCAGLQDLHEETSLRGALLHSVSQHGADICLQCDCPARINLR